MCFPFSHCVIFHNSSFAFFFFSPHFSPSIFSVFPDRGETYWRECVERQSLFSQRKAGIRTHKHTHTHTGRDVPGKWHLCSPLGRDSVDLCGPFTYGDQLLERNWNQGSHLRGNIRGDETCWTDAFPSRSFSALYQCRGSSRLARFFRSAGLCCRLQQPAIRLAAIEPSH